MALNFILSFRTGTNKTFHSAHQGEELTTVSLFKAVVNYTTEQERHEWSSL